MLGFGNFVGITNMKQEVTQQVEKAVPAVVGTAITVADVNTYVTIGVGLATLVYVLYQTYVLHWKFQEAKRRLKEQQEQSPLDSDSAPL